MMRRYANKRARELVAWARQRGWQVTITGSSHLRFDRPGCQPYFAGSTPSDKRSSTHARVEMTRLEREAEQGA